MVPNQTLWTFGVPWGLSGTINSCFGVSRAKKLVKLVLPVPWHTVLWKAHVHDPPKCSQVDFSILLGKYMLNNPRECKKNVVLDRPSLLDHQKWDCPMVKISLAKKLDILALMKSTCLCPLPSAPEWIFQFFWVDICLTIPENAKKNVIPDRPRLLDHQKWACPIDKISVFYLLINQVLSTYKV